MKFLKFNASNVVPYLFEDSVTITIKSNQIEIGEPDYLEFIIGDMNSENAALVEGVTAPEAGWVGSKFTYIDGEWAIVEGWEDPE